MKLKLYSPIPKITRDNFEEYKASAMKKGRPVNSKIPKLELGFDEELHPEYEEYEDHLLELNEWKLVHENVFKEKLEINHPEAKVIKLKYPTSSRRTTGFLSEYGQDDILFIHAHGNGEAIGVGGFNLDHRQLAQNLATMGLSKEHPPTIIVWACLSGRPRKSFNGNTYAKRLRNSLVKRKYDNIAVIGVDGYIWFGDPIEAVSYAKKLRQETEAGVSVKFVKISAAEALNINVTPGVVAAVHRDGESIFTTTKILVEERMLRRIKQREEALGESPTMRRATARRRRPKRGTATSTATVTAAPPAAISAQNARLSTLRIYRHQALPAVDSTSASATSESTLHEIREELVRMEDTLCEYDETRGEYVETSDASQISPPLQDQDQDQDEATVRQQLLEELHKMTDMIDEYNRYVTARPTAKNKLR